MARGAGTALVLAVHARLEWYPRISIWRQNTGAIPIGEGKARRFIRFGSVGAADLSGIGPYGVRLEIECKDGSGRLSPAQRAFQATIVQHGGIYLIVRSVDDCVTQLDRALASRAPPPRAA